MGARRPKLPRSYLARDTEADDLRVVRASGSTVVDARGRRYVDFFMGWCVGNLGYAQREIRARLARFDGPDYVAPTFEYRPWHELAAMLAEIAPGKLRRSFRAVGGTEAVEIALQVAMVCTGRGKLLSIADAYHGNSLAARSIGSADNREIYPSLLSGCRKIAPPLDREAVRRVEAALEGRDVAALIMEPVICNLGALVPTEAFMAGVQRACRRHGTLLIMDEVACGFGRTGKLFASEHFDIAPDILCLAKAITGGHAPLGATLVTDEVYARLDGRLDFWSTFGWHPRSVAAAIATLRWLRRHGAGLLRNVGQRSAQFAERLSAMDFGPGAQLRVKGLAIGVELGDAERAAELVERCRERGLLITSDEDVLHIFPALTLDAATATRGLDILERCL
jgi:acetylornithine/succinyldiaminopimelate/putrescine aminotransferase